MSGHVSQVMCVVAVELSQLEGFKGTLCRGVPYQSPATECRKPAHVRDSAVQLELRVQYPHPML